MLSVAATIMCGGAPGSRIDQFVPLILSVAGLIAYLSVDRNPRWGLPRDLANVLGLGTIGLLLWEYMSDETQLIRHLGHWLICLHLIKYFLPKTSEDDWFLFLAGLTEVLIGSVTNLGDMVGVWIFAWAMLAVWVLGLFFLEREIRRFRSSPSSGKAVVVPETDRPYRGLFNIPYLAATLRVLALTLVSGGFFFLLLPRQAGATRSRSPVTTTKHLAGFDNEVKLGQLGEILENDSVVMSVEFTDEKRRPIQPPSEPLFRGVTLIGYKNGRWHRSSERITNTVVSLKPVPNSGASRRTVIRQIVKLEPSDAPTLFALRPVLDLSSVSRLAPFLNPLDGTIFKSDSRGGYDYEVLSDTDQNAPQESEEVPHEVRLKSYLAFPEPLKGRLRDFALPLLEKVPGQGIEALTARARALEAYLRDSGEFRYTLEMNVVDPGLDPVEDFLIKRKMGHCEYFASALALLLRSVGIPSRLVNGFKGGDWNQVTGSMNVRQKHAHSWVEAYVGKVASVGKDGGDLALWITLDPTPAADRDESVAQVGGVASTVRPFTDIIRHIWVFYILGYDSARQNRLLYAPIRLTAQKVRDSYATIWGWTKSVFKRLFRFQSISSFISIKGFLVTFLVLFPLAVLGKLLAWAGKRLLCWWRGPTDEASGPSAGILFYRRMAQMLETYELSRAAVETQKEFAVRASRFLTGRREPTDGAASVPPKIVDAYYQVRFGHHQLDPETLRELEGDLDLLERQLSTNPDQ